MNGKFESVLEDAFYQMKYESYLIGRVLGKMKRFPDERDPAKYKYQLGKYFANKFSMTMVQLILRQFQKFKDFDEYMLPSEIAFARYCNALGTASASEMELMFAAVVHEYEQKHTMINAGRFPEWATIVEGKKDSYRKSHHIFERTGVYMVSRYPNVLDD